MNILKLCTTTFIATPAIIILLSAASHAQTATQEIRNPDGSTTRNLTVPGAASTTDVNLPHPPAAYATSLPSRSPSNTPSDNPAQNLSLTRGAIPRPPSPGFQDPNQNTPKPTKPEEYAIALPVNTPSSKTQATLSFSQPAAQQKPPANQQAPIDESGLLTLPPPAPKPAGNIPASAIQSMIPNNQTNEIKPGDQPSSGLATYITPEQMQKEITNRTGPELPDASVYPHLDDLGRDANYYRQQHILTQQEAVDDAILATLKKESEIKQQIYISKLPIEQQIAMSGSANGQSAGQNPYSAQAPSFPPTMPGLGPITQPTNAPTPVNMGNQVNIGNQSAPPPTDNNQKEKEQIKTTTPVVSFIGGTNKDMRADILVPYAGSFQDARAGDKLPGGYTIKSITDVVTVTDKDNVLRTLPFGREVPAYARQAPQITQSQ